jgi:leucyl/phenylalanyl-tRNA--protein transferase
MDGWSVTGASAIDESETMTSPEVSAQPESDPASYVERVRAGLERGRTLADKAWERGSGRCQRLLGAASAAFPRNPFLGLCGIADSVPLSPEQAILGYSQGLFPMDVHGKIKWNCPSPRFVLYLDQLRLSSNMRRDIRKAGFTFTFDKAPVEVVDACAARTETWLSSRLRALYLELFQLGVMHSVEAWQDGELVGGNFGMAIGRVFTGETMFHRKKDAGKAAFAHLAQHLIARGFVCVDGQHYSDHFSRFGATEVPLDRYRKTLALGLIQPASFHDKVGEVAAATPQAKLPG